MSPLTTSRIWEPPRFLANKPDRQAIYKKGIEMIGLMTKEDYPVSYLDFEDLCIVLETLDILKGRIITEVIRGVHDNDGWYHGVTVKRLVTSE